MKPQYDDLVDYAEFGPAQAFAREAVYPSLLDLMGDVEGQWILDLACGHGVIGQELVARGAQMVIGIDESPKMLEIARSKNSKPWNLDFRWGRVGSLGPVGCFSTITAGYLLHYASQKPEIAAMIADIKENLLPGGILYAINTDPLKIERHFGRPMIEGEKLEWHIEGMKKPFYNFYWRRRTYEKYFRDAGFTIEWIEPWPTEEGLRLHPQEWWDRELLSKCVSLLRCVRIG